MFKRKLKNIRTKRRNTNSFITKYNSSEGPRNSRIFLCVNATEHPKRNRTFEYIGGAWKFNLKQEIQWIKLINQQQSACQTLKYQVNKLNVSESVKHLGKRRKTFVSVRLCATAMINFASDPSEVFFLVTDIPVPFVLFWNSVAGFFF